MQYCKASLCLRLGITDHVRIRQSSGCHKLFLPQGFHCGQTIPQRRCQLKFQILRCIQHLGTDFLRDRLVITIQQLSRLFHPKTILRAAFSFLAPSFTLIHVIIQTGSVLANVPGKFFVTTRQFQGQADGFHHIVGDGTTSVGTVITGTIIGQLADHGDFRINIFHIQP